MLHDKLILILKDPQSKKDAEIPEPDEQENWNITCCEEVFYAIFLIIELYLTYKSSKT